MNDVMLESLFFGVLVSCVTYELGGWLRKKTKISLINPLLFSIIAVIAVLLACNIDYDTYYNGAKYLISPISNNTPTNGLNSFSFAL